VLHCEGHRISGVDLFPYRIADTGLQLLYGSDDADFRRTLDALSAPLKSSSGPGRAWQAYLAYYGMAGFAGEVQGILDRMKTEPHKAAAMFRNRLTTMQHSELWRECLTGIMSGGEWKYPAGAWRMVEEYFTRKA